MKTWYLAYCKPREEQRASEHCKMMGIDSYYPQVLAKKIRYGKIVQQYEPMFPNYLFLHVNLEQVSPSKIKYIRGIRKMIGFGNNWATVDPLIIYSMMLNDDTPAMREKYNQLPKEGDCVEISTGAFSGMKAIYQEPDGDHRATLLIEILNQNTPTSVDNRDFIVTTTQHTGTTEKN